MENSRQARESAAAARHREARSAGNAEESKVADTATTAAEEDQSRERQPEQERGRVYKDLLDFLNRDEAYADGAYSRRQDQRSSAQRYHPCGHFLKRESDQDRSVPTQSHAQGQPPHDNGFGTRARRRGEAKATDQDRASRQPSRSQMPPSVKVERRSASPLFHGASRPRGATPANVSRVHASFRPTGLPTNGTEGIVMDHGRNGAVDPVAMQSPGNVIERIAASDPSGGPALIHGVDYLLNDAYEIWPMREYPEPGRPDTLGRCTRRFRYEGPAAHPDSNDYLNMVKAAKQQLATQFPCVPAEDWVVTLPKRIGQSLFLDVFAKNNLLYLKIRGADLSPFKLACSSAPYPEYQVLLRVDSLDIRNGRGDVLNSMREALRAQGKIIAFWPIYYKDMIINGIPTQSDFTGTVYVLLRWTGPLGLSERVDTSRLPAFLDFADLPFPKRLPLVFTGRPADCEQCSGKEPLHLAKDCPSRMCKCGGNHSAKNCPRKHNRFSRGRRKWPLW
ncbi:hypothetical protein L1887_55626 [Cichorium endivia]|nr:hypothetical protein L1887_55626 [Cichorium endivia]